MSPKGTSSGRWTQRDRAAAGLSFGPYDIGLIVAFDGERPFVYLPPEFEQQLPKPKSSEEHRLKAILAQMIRTGNDPAGGVRVDFAGGHAFRFTATTANNAKGQAAA